MHAGYRFATRLTGSSEIFINLVEPLSVYFVFAIGRHRRDGLQHRRHQRPGRIDQRELL